jgi:hypothetical protein
VTRLALLVAAGALVACGRGLPPQATAIDAERAHVELARLQRGRELVIRKCGSSCHRPPQPSQHTPAAWPATIDEMSERAQLRPDEKALIAQYLVTMAGRAPR